MTDLHKTIRRRSREQFAHYRKRIVISLEPGDVIGMRLERTRTTYRAPLPVALYIRNDNRRAKLVKLIATCGPLDIHLRWREKVPIYFTRGDSMQKKTAGW